MGLYFLNISVDTADANPAHVAEDLSINDQESIVEIVVEKVFGFENAIKEYDDHDPEDHNTKTSIKIEVIGPCLHDLRINQVLLETTKLLLPKLTTSLTSGIYTLVTPPPES